MSEYLASQLSPGRPAVQSPLLATKITARLQLSTLPILSPRDTLLSDAHSCSTCTRMGNSKRVLTDLNGPWDAQVVFVAEAPGRLGAEVTGIPLFGDRTGDRFEELLRAMKWNRCDVFITNAVLCNPRDENGNNDTPSRKEIANCSRLLRQTIDVIDPLLVVALGRVALEALRAISEHEADLRTQAGRIIPWANRRLGILYHPGPRTAVHRSWNLQLRDAEQIAAVASTFLDTRAHRSSYPEVLLPIGLDYTPAI